MPRAAITEHGRAGVEAADNAIETLGTMEAWPDRMLETFKLLLLGAFFCGLVTSAIA